MTRRASAVAKSAPNAPYSAFPSGRIVQLEIGEVTEIADRRKHDVRQSDRDFLAMASAKSVPFGRNAISWHSDRQLQEPVL
jgi:hypothetical protein